MGKAINAAGELIDTPSVSEADRATAKARGNERRRQGEWADRKRQAQAALAATDYLALSDRRPMTGAEKAYREALRAVARAEPTGTPPALPTL